MRSGNGAISGTSPWQTFGKLRVRVVRYRANAIQERHRHRESSLSLVLAGELEETSSAMSYRASAGSVVIKPAEYWHSNRYGPRGTCIVQIRLDAAEACWDAVLREYGWLDSPCFAGAVLALLNGRVAARESGELSFWNVVESLFPARTRQAASPQPSWWADALDLLGQCTIQPVSVTEVALRAGVHPVHFARVFRARFGCTVRRYIRERRVLAAWRACEACDESLVAIAARSGFADQAHMTRAFTEILGVSPGRLKRLGLRAASSL
jgi:AraC family transcriptional regulator